MILMMHFFYLFFFVTVIEINVKAECPRKKIAGFKAQNEATTTQRTESPGLVPPEIWINCIYMYNSKSELDQVFSDDMLAVLDEITQRLKQEVRINLIVEKLNCAENEESKCLQYSLHKSFHWLIIKDPKDGDVVYEFITKLNDKKAIIEASLLNVLSQHTIYDLAIYCSEEASKEVGFARRLSNEELTEKERKLKVSKSKNAILRSSLELNLIEPLLLQQRSFDVHLNYQQLKRLDESNLDDAINTDQLTFILFWNKDDIISKHAFYLWAEASKLLLLRHPTNIFGALACHEFNQLCNNYITKSSDYHTVFAFQKNDIFGKTKELRDAAYYIDWVELLILSPAYEIRSDDELKQIKAGKLELFDEIRPAITIGIFSDRYSNEAKTFFQVAENLKGLYHFVYLIKESHPNTIYTIRVMEKRKRIDFTDVYEIPEFTNFVIQSSLPAVIDVSNGFTSDILTHQLQPIILFIDNGDQEEKSKFADLCAKSSYIICTTIINSTKSKEFDQLINSININDHSKRIIIFLREKIYALDVKDSLKSENLLQLIAVTTVNKPISVLALEDVHPLRYLQISQINKIFGEQLIEIPSEVEFIGEYYRNKNDKMDDTDDYGGCPVMAKARQAVMRDEL